MNRQSCETAGPCWQVQTNQGMMFGFELEYHAGKRFGGKIHQRLLTKPVDQMSTPLRLEE
jgi:hypothetical protein